MLGAIIGDIVGSRFEFNNVKTKDFGNLFTSDCFFTDDTVMTLAVAKSIVEYYKQDELKVRLPDFVQMNMQEMGRKYKHRGYGTMMLQWINSKKPVPYNSFGNGAVMRISPVADVSYDVYSAMYMAEDVTNVTHNHPESIKAVKAVMDVIFALKRDIPLEDIRYMVKREYYPEMDDNFTLEKIRKDYKFDETCQGSVPQALQAFFESTSFEDAIRNAISIGGDSDTIACIVGMIAEHKYKIPDNLKLMALNYLDKDMKKIIKDFYILIGGFNRR